MTKISSKTGNCPRIWMAPKLFAYLHAKMSRKINVVKNAKNLTLPYMDQSWCNFHTKFFSLKRFKRCPQIFLKPVWGRAMDQNVWKKWNCENFSRNKNKNILRGEFLDLYSLLVRVSRESGLGTILNPILRYYVFSYSVSKVTIALESSYLFCLTWIRWQHDWVLSIYLAMRSISY